MSQAKASSLSKILYRALLRWSKQFADVPISLRASDVGLLAPTIPPGAVPLQSARAVSLLTRLSFRHHLHLSPNTDTDTETDQLRLATDRAFEALRLLNTVYAASANAMRQTRSDRINREGIAFQVGQVFIHKRFGYRGVVYGWDRRCERDEDWVQAMGVDPSLPHYYVLPDERDCEKLFGGVRLSKYVCENNLLPVTGVTIVHRALENYFCGYSPGLQRYIPTRRVQYEYPSVYSVDSFETLEPVDSNVLKHYSGGGGGGGGEKGGGGGGGDVGKEGKNPPPCPFREAQ